MLFGAPLAWGHVGVLLDSVDVAVVPGESTYDLELSVGLVVFEGAEGRWLCHELVTEDGAVQSPRFARSTSGGRMSMLRDPVQARDGVGLWWSDDGCSWTAATGLGGRGALSGGFDPTDADRALVVARDSSGATALLRSTDGAHSWSVVPELDGAVIHDLGLRYGTDGRAWVGATTDASRLWVLDGDSWSAVDVPGADGAPVWVAAIDPLKPDNLLVVVDPVGLDTLLRFDGGVWTELALEGELVDAAAAADGQFWMILNGDRLVHSGSEPERTSRGVGMERVGADVLVTTHPLETGWLLHRVTAEGLDDLWYPAHVTAPLSCPANSDMVRTCEPLWPEAQAQMADIAGEPPGSQSDTGLQPDTGAGGVVLKKRCGCDAVGGGAGWLWLPLFWLVRRSGAASNPGEQERCEP